MEQVLVAQEVLVAEQVEQLGRPARRDSAGARRGVHAPLVHGPVESAKRGDLARGQAAQEDAPASAATPSWTTPPERMIGRNGEVNRGRAAIGRGSSRVAWSRVSLGNLAQPSTDSGDRPQAR